MAKIIIPTINAMKTEGREYQGVLYAGLMITKSGPRVIEFNCRFGDPETQVLLPRLKSDLLPILIACANKTLAKEKAIWTSEACTCVVVASNGYPGKYEKGKVITGIDKVKKAIVFHAGTKLGDGKVVTSGGRVLGVSALGATIKESIDNAYKEIPLISFDGAYYRKDVGKKALKK